ncbi:AAA family ATPase [Vibrio sp. DNB22_19_1]
MNKFKHLIWSKFAKYTQKFGELALSRGSQGFDLNLAWLVKDFFPLMSFGVIFGSSGAFKSFLAIDIACSIATGQAWNGKRVRKGAVLYVAAEGQLNISRRIRAWEVANNIQADNVFVLGHSLYVAEEHAQEATINAIKEIKAQTGLDVEMIVIDTLSRCFTGDENTATDMTKFVRGCDKIRAAYYHTPICTWKIIRANSIT